MKHIKRFLWAILVITVCALMVPAESLAISDTSGIPHAALEGYKDIQGGWFENWAKSYGYTNIFSSGDGCFYPNQAITRMEFARMLHEALDINMAYFAAVDISEYYDDVTSANVGANELYDLTTCGIIDTKSHFRPAEHLERQEMIHFVMNAFYHFAGNDYALPTLTLPPFADDSEIKTEYRTDVNRSAMLGLVNGKGDNFLRPREMATRAEAVTIAGRLAKLLKEYQSGITVKTSAREVDGQLHLQLSILNHTKKTITINHNNGQIFDFLIQDKNGKELYRWSEGRMFTMMMSSTKIDPGGAMVFSDTLDTQTYSKIKDQIASIQAYITGNSEDFKINPGGYLVSDALAE